MINFHTITLKAQELNDPKTGVSRPEIFCSPIQILFSRARDVIFNEGDSAEVLLTDGSRFIFLYENDSWICCQYNHKKGQDDVPDVDLITLYGPYELLEDALNDLISKRNYIASVN